jgi:hypothetical protein
MVVSHMTAWLNLGSDQAAGNCATGGVLRSRRISVTPRLDTEDWSEGARVEATADKVRTDVRRQLFRHPSIGTVDHPSQHLSSCPVVSSGSPRCPEEEHRRDAECNVIGRFGYRQCLLRIMDCLGVSGSEGDQATHGSPAKFSYCVAENEAATPWEPFRVTRGFA